jgi:hypothetical protein
VDTLCIIYVVTKDLEEHIIFYPAGGGKFPKVNKDLQDNTVSTQKITISPP